MTDQITKTELVARVLSRAAEPLTLDDILEQINQVCPLETKDPATTIRGAIASLPLATTLGGRPARYAWWPNRLPGSVFRQPLSPRDLSSGSLVLTEETWLALWPDFFTAEGRRKGNVTLEFANGPTVKTRITHQVGGETGWGLPPTPELAAWYSQVGAAVGDDLILRVVDVEARVYAVRLARRAERDQVALARRNAELADVAERVLQYSGIDMPNFYLIPRLIANDVYRHPLPPDPWAEVLRADLRYVLRESQSVSLVKTLVNALEKQWDVPPDPFGVPLPRGRWYEARTEEDRRMWADYLFSHGMEYRWAKSPTLAEAYYRAALQLDDGHADAWVHLGNTRFEEGLVREALAHYRRAQAAAEARTIGDSAEYTRPFWGDLDSRPFMRALHGQGLCLWRLGRLGEARDVFKWMLELNPYDNQGVRFLLRGLGRGLSWEQYVASEEANWDF